MDSKWNDKEAKNYKSDLGMRVYTSRLLGQDASLVLHGGGNTSVKITEKNIFNEDEEILYVKGSGWNLETIEKAGFSPVKLDAMKKLSQLEKLSDPQMVNEMKTNMTKYSAPSPSVETILHAIIPFKFVDHTHADAVVTVTNTPNGLDYVKEIYGDSVIYIPYIMPGFDLARYCGEAFEKEATDKTIGMVLMNHGMFSFADTAKESYERMIKLIDMAENFIKNKNAWDYPVTGGEINELSDEDYIQISNVRLKTSEAAGVPVILKTVRNEKAMNFTTHKSIEKIGQIGPATPDHIIRTKRLPAIGTDVDKYVANYLNYFTAQSENYNAPVTMLDPAPRVLLDEKFGLMCAGRNVTEANIINDIYNHTIDIILRSEQLGAYQALSAKDLFQMEYWDLEQAKLKKNSSPPEFQGEVVLVTGAASGIGKACVEKFLNKGACVAALDLKPDIKDLLSGANYCGIQCDITNESELKKAIGQIVQQFGGIDMVILNAGIFPKSQSIADMNMDTWKKVMNINLDANVQLLSLCFPILKNAPNKGRVVFIGSKNVKAPGPGASAYSASKAALNQLARVAALEWGKDGIRINSIHPNAVFDTGIWSNEVLEQRAKSYGLSVEKYKKNNILKTSVTSVDVADMATEMCSKTFSKTTGESVALDGGNERVI